MRDRGILTIACGSQEYIKMGKGLARSLRLNNKEAKIALVTDNRDPELPGLFDVIIPADMSLGKGVVQKLFVDRYSPFQETLYIDADCLIYGNPDLLWKLYRCADGFGIPGWGYIGANDYHYAVKDMNVYLSMFGVQRISNINSGVFYYNRSELSMKIFETARKIYYEKSDLGLKTFKTSPIADEPIFSMAMELNSVSMLPWDHRAVSPACGNVAGLEEVNVLGGSSKYKYEGGDVEPIIIHYSVNAQSSYIYLRELKRLELHERYGSAMFSSLIAFMEYTYERMRIYTRRARQRVDMHGIIGLVPERILKR